MHKTSYTHLSGGLTSRYQAHMPLERNNKILIITQVQCTVKFNTDNYAKRGAIRCREMSHTMCVYYMRCALHTTPHVCREQTSVRPSRALACSWQMWVSLSLFLLPLSLSLWCSRICQWLTCTPLPTCSLASTKAHTHPIAHSYTHKSIASVGLSLSSLRIYNFHLAPFGIECISRCERREHNSHSSSQKYIRCNCIREDFQLLGAQEGDA